MTWVRRGAAFGAVCAVAIACSRDEGEPSPPVAASLLPPASAAAPAAPRGTKAPEETGSLDKPDGYEEMTVGGVAPTARGNAVVLMDAISGRGVLIFVGGTEALSLSLRLRGERYARPLTHDLLDAVVGRFGAKVAHVRVDKLQNNVFHGTVLVQNGDDVIAIDARPSDAMALAVGNDVPIYVAKTVIDAVGIDLSDVEITPPDKVKPSRGVPERPGEVRL